MTLTQTNENVRKPSIGNNKPMRFSSIIEIESTWKWKKLFELIVSRPENAVCDNRENNDD